jgi:hypothetical protein
MFIHSLLLVGTPISTKLLQDKLNLLLDPGKNLIKIGGCILEIFELQQGTYLVVINMISPLLVSLYQNLYLDDARFIFKDAIYTVSIADNTKHRYMVPRPWKTNGPYEHCGILYKRNTKLFYSCEHIES